jgi:hypothetical protein
MTTCRHCGDVIGVYERMIVVAEGRGRMTSRAAERDRGGLDDAELLGDCYHHPCYFKAYGSDAAIE